MEGDLMGKEIRRELMNFYPRPHMEGDILL